MKEKTDDILQRSSLKENPFGAPAGYFSSMQQEVMAKVSAMPHPQTQTADPAPAVTFMTYLKPALALASVFGIVFGMGYVAIKLTDVIGNKDVSAGISAPVADNTQSQEVSDAYMASILDITIEDLFATIEGGDSAIDIISPEINKETIEQYLIETGVSTSSIALLE